MATVTFKKKTLMHEIIDNIATVIVGKDETLAFICMALACDGHILIEDVPGTGKTTLAIALAKSIGGSFNRISCTPDVMPSDIVGFSMYNPGTGSFDYKEGSIMANVFLADEINRTPPKTQSGLLEAMEERTITVDGSIYALPDPFFVIATQNPIEYLGTYPLPEAQLDRFLIRVKLGYPSAAQESAILERFSGEHPLASLRAVTDLAAIKKLQHAILDVKLKSKVREYIVNLANASRTHSQLALGLSPRATLNLAKMARAYAYYNNRDYVIPDDVKAVFAICCAHRVVAKSEAKYQNLSNEAILNDLLNGVVVQG